MAKDQHSLKIKLIAKNGARVEDVNIRLSMNSEFQLIFNLQLIDCEHSNDDDNDKATTTTTTTRWRQRQDDDDDDDDVDDDANYDDADDRTTKPSLSLCKF